MAGKFEPKTPVTLQPPKDDPITLEELATANGVDGGKCYVAIKGLVYDVTGNKAYQPGGSYNEDVKSEWQDLDDKEKGVLNDWITFFSKRYNVIGKVVGATNTD